MQRDLGNEVIVAIAAVGILAFAITFAIILSLSNTPETLPTATIITNVDDGTEVATSVAVVASNTTPVTTATAIPTSAATASETISPATVATIIPTSPATASETISPATATEIDESSTPVQPATTTTNEASTPTEQTPENTATLAPSEAQVSIPTAATQTRNTNSPTPQREISTVTSTPRLPTSTSSFTPSPTPTLTKTVTPLPPTNTPTRTPTKTPTPSPTATRTPRATETSGIRPTPTANLTPIGLALTPGSTCIVPQGWVAYLVRQGDTLLKIARATGSTLLELQTSNCLTDIDNIYTGTVLFVPRSPVITANPIPVPGTPSVMPPLYVEGCTDPNSTITNLRLGDVVSGVFSVMGTANITDFWYYKLEVRPDFATVYNFYSRSETPVVNGELGQIDQSIFGTGIHWIKLTVIGKTTGSAPCVIPVIFQ